MKNIGVCLLFIVSMNVFAQQTDFKKFHEGIFKTFGERGEEYIITRKGNTQIELDISTKSKIELCVHWIDSCTYTLQFKKYLTKSNNEKFNQDLILTVKIIEIKENSYVQQTTANKYETAYVGEVFKIQ